jgi:hypothetical protein
LEAVLPSPLKLLLSLKILPREELDRLLPKTELEKKLRDSISFVKVAYKTWETLEQHQEWSRVFDLLDEARESVERCWFTLPADTRPCFNTSGLIPHSLTTSALAWIHATNEGKGRREADIIRIASLIHDFGKPFAFHDHVGHSLMVLEYLLGDILDPRTLSEVRETVKHHHNMKHPMGGVIAWADHRASASDRIGAFLRVMFREEFGREVDEGEVESWDFWKNQSEIIRPLSERFVNEMERASENFLKISMPEKLEEELKKSVYEPIKEVEFVCVDVGGIQDFISEREELKSVGAASFTIDCLVTAQIPIFLQREFEQKGVWLPLENFLYTAGGNVTLLIPSSFADGLKQSLKSLSPLQLRVAHAPFKALYFELSRDIAQKLGLEKISQ